MNGLRICPTEKNGVHYDSLDSAFYHDPGFSQLPTDDLAYTHIEVIRVRGETYFIPYTVIPFPLHICDLKPSWPFFEDPRHDFCNLQCEHKVAFIDAEGKPAT